MLFGAVAAIIGLAIAALLARAILRSDAGAVTSDQTVSVYKAQLSEVDSDRARGVLTETEAEALRAEVSRRLLAAADAPDAGFQAGPRWPLLVLVVTVVLGGGGAMYYQIGAPSMPDQPLAQRLTENAERYAARPRQAEVEAILDERGEAPEALAAPSADQLDLLDQLRTVLETRTDDLRGHRLLADNLARLGLWRDAAVAQADVLRILGDTATGQDHIDHAEYLILAVNGYVSPEAEDALARGVRLTPNDPRGRYYSGLGTLQAGRVDLTYDLWVRLLAEGPPDAPWVRAIQSQIRDIALAAGRQIPRGPTAEDIEAASEMTAAERDEMIRGMVAGLSDRLATEGGPAEDWARLIRAYGVLGERAQANRIWTEAREVFAGAPADLALIRQAAQDAEVLQ